MYTALICVKYWWPYIIKITKFYHNLITLLRGFLFVLLSYNTQLVQMHHKLLNCHVLVITNIFEILLNFYNFRIVLSYSIVACYCKTQYTNKFMLWILNHYTFVFFFYFPECLVTFGRQIFDMDGLIEILPSELKSDSLFQFHLYVNLPLPHPDYW